MNTIIKRFSQHPKQLLIVDAAGAFITSLLLLLIRQFFSIQFGVLQITINCLSLTALLIFLYSSTCYLTLKTVHWRILLSIAIVNLLYCLLTLALMIYQYSELKLLGILYFSIEIAVIIFLMIIEYKVSVAIKQKRSEY